MPTNKEFAALCNFKNARIAVIGDIMLDVYLWGSVTRISPEAPVPVVDVLRRSCCPGGAANVMRNISTVGAKAVAFGVIGEDSSGDDLLVQLAEHQIDTTGIIRCAGRRTTEKCRVIAGAQQLCRADFEESGPVAADIRERMTTAVCELISAGKVDAVIFDDYAKGVLHASMLAEIIKCARKSGVITVLDPKPKAGGVTPVSGLTLLKPNRSEAFALAGISDPGPASSPQEDRALAAAAAKIFDIWHPENLLISLAGQGMILYPAKGDFCVIPTRAREVFDVSGAGDTVAAVASVAMATGADPVLAAGLANCAAGVVVGKIGTAPVFYDELLNAISQKQENSSANKGY